MPRVVLELEDGTTFEGYSFGAEQSVAGEVVFNTGMVGYPESLTDPSYRGEILVCTYPLIGNYGVPAEDRSDGLGRHFESYQIHAKALVVSTYSQQFSHWNAARSLAEWLKSEGVPGVTGIDTRSLTKRLREKGTMLGVIRFDGEPVEFYDTHQDNLVAQASISEPRRYAPQSSSVGRVVLFDCGAKDNIVRSLVGRGCEVIRVPWDYSIENEEFDGLMVSNGPGDPKKADRTIEQIRKVIDRQIPIFGICMGHQLLSLAIGADTYKLKYGHRSQNQPVLQCGTKRCFVTSQNHGYAVDHDRLPKGWAPWFINLNDGTSEGIRHESGRFCSVQFHPEATPGPVDTAFLFDDFVRAIQQ